MCSLISHDDGRAGVRRLLIAAAVALGSVLPGTRLAATADPDPSTVVSVSEESGLYLVTARFDVPQPPAVALAVLSDYEQIPRFMPGVRSSVVIERSPGRLVVEQEAVSRLMMFSKTVRLVLEVTEAGDTITFLDRSGRSFVRYEGAWRTVPHDGGTTITYRLSARPAFDVPQFVLKRLLKRDSGQMISRLRTGIATRGR